MRKRPARKPPSERGRIQDPVVAFATAKRTLVFDNLNDVRTAERLIEEGDAFATAIVNGDRSDATMQSAREYSRKLHAEIKRHRERAEAYRAEHGEPKSGSIAARLLRSSAECREQMLDAVLGIDYIVDTEGKGPIIGETARLN